MNDEPVFGHRTKEFALLINSNIVAQLKLEELMMEANELMAIIVSSVRTIKRRRR